MSFLKSFLRTAVYPAVFNLGLPRFLNLFSKSNRLILVYHGVSETPQHDISKNVIDLNQFKREMKYLSKKFNLVSVSDLYNPDFTGNGIAITFDDGYLNNLTHAAPVLDELKIPATFFCLSGYLESDKSDYVTWYDLWDMMRSSIPESQFKKYGEGLSVLTFKDFLKKQTPGQRDEILRSIATSINFNLDQQIYHAINRRLMSVSQIKELSSSNFFEIGSHTVNHPNLEFLTDKEIAEELTDSKRTLENIIRKPVNSIAFPDGSYDERVLKKAIEIGYQQLLAVDLNSNKDAVVFSQLKPRYCISCTSTYEANMIQVIRAFNTHGI